jgi:hypothetical protein
MVTALSSYSSTPIATKALVWSVEVLFVAIVFMTCPPLREDKEESVTTIGFVQIVG